jgi:hypothetical protein
MSPYYSPPVPGKSHPRSEWDAPMIPHVLLRASGVCVTAAIVAGCGSQTPFGATGAIPPGGAAIAQAQHARSWTSPEAKSRALLYVSDPQTKDVYVYSYPQARLVGKLSGFGEPRSECADAAGDVFIADVATDDVVEYAHGGTKPIAELSVSGHPEGCSVDPMHGSLAVSGGVNGIVLSVFRYSAHNRWRAERTYTDSSLHAAAFCGYDNRGNLFIDALNHRGKFVLAELARGGASFATIALSAAIKRPGEIEWDGTDLAVGDAGTAPPVIDRFSISGNSGTKVGSTTLGSAKGVAQFWIASAHVVGPDFEKDDVGFWSYPAGGSPTKTIGGVYGYGAAVSVAK